MTSSTEVIKDEVIRFYQEGHSLAETAQHFSVGVNAVYKCLKRHAVQRHPNGVVLRSREWKEKRWTQEKRDEHRARLQGKPSGAFGKQWKFDRPIHRPGVRGEKNPAWRGGILSLSRAIRDLPEYRIWRDAIFKRDNYTCVQCGTRSCRGNKVILNADHIIPFVTLLRQYKIASVKDAMHCIDLWDVKNGRTLCDPCHRGTDTYGLNLIYYETN